MLEPDYPEWPSCLDELPPDDQPGLPPVEQCKEDGCDALIPRSRTFCPDHTPYEKHQRDLERIVYVMDHISEEVGVACANPLGDGNVYRYHEGAWQAVSGADLLAYVEHVRWWRWTRSPSRIPS